MPFGEIYIPLYVGFGRDPKVRRLVQASGSEGMAAAYLYLMMACYCREELTDGFVPTEQLGALAYPVGIRTARRLADLLQDEKLIRPRVSSDGTGWTVPAYVKRNGTRADAEKRADQARSAARQRWNSSGPRSDPHAHGSASGTAGRTTGRNATGNAGRSATGNAKSETESESESKESSAGVVDSRAPARGRARDPDDDRISSNSNNPDDDDELDQRIVIMLAAHGFTVNRQQARGVRLRIIGGRKIDNAARYVSAALATRDGARKWAPSAPSMPPRGLDPVTAIRSAGLRGSGGYESVGDAPMPPWDQPRPVQDTLDDDVAADVAHRGAAEARKRLAERPRAEAVPVAPPSRQLHGEALAAAQLAEAREALAAAGVAEAPDDGEEDPRDITDVDLPEDGDDPPF